MRGVPLKSGAHAGFKECARCAHPAIQNNSLRVQQARHACQSNPQVLAVLAPEAAAIGAATAREADGGYTPPYEVVRALLLFGAHAAGVPAIEAVYPGFRDGEGLARYAARGRRDGFSGMLAIHPSQVCVINQAFSVSADEVAWARRVVALFDAHPGAGALSLDGKMVDLPHLKQALHLLSLSN